VILAASVDKQADFRRKVGLLGAELAYSLIDALLETDSLPANWIPFKNA